MAPIQSNRRFIVLAIMSATIWCYLPTLHAQRIPFQEVHFASGESRAAVNGSVTGSGAYDYKLTAQAGQTMRVKLKAGTPSLYFNVMPPGKGASLYLGAQAGGNEFSGVLPLDGEYIVRLYLMGNARDEDLKVPYTVEFAIDGAMQEPGGKDYNKTFSLQGIEFRVMTSVDDQKRTRLAVTPKGLEIENSRQERFIEGVVTGAEAADLNSDGSAEIYVFVRGPGESGKGALYGWAANNKRSLSEIYLADPAPGDPNFIGYRGGDQFAVVESIIGRRFPVNGKTRQIQYKLKQGEAGWLLQVDKVIEF